MNNKNIIITILVLIVLGFAGYFLFAAGDASKEISSTTSTNSNSNPPAIPQEKPDAPIVQTDSDVSPSNSTAIAKGRVTPNGALTDFWFEYSEDSLLGNIIGTVTPTQSASNGLNSIAISASVGDLSDNTRYFYRVVGRNQYGTVRGDVVSFRTRPE